MTYTNESRTPQAAIASRRMARRLLSGAGCASLTAYRLDADASAQLVLHALDVTGSIIVAAHPAADHPMAEVPCESPIEVRLDVALEAAEPGLRITTATVHLLGVLTGSMTSRATPSCPAQWRGATVRSRGRIR